ncbi:MAG: dienelactone hydrolase family protein [Caldilineae bacterium]|nr:MAG: dienelactone hydrolase family protein [Caldilineae bacterium]
MDRVYVMNLVASFQLGQISRRQFLRRASAALGSTALANTLLAACATVPPNAPAPAPIAPAGTSAPAPEPAASAGKEEAGVIAEDVSYPDRDGETLNGYLARPGDGTPAPGVIVIQEWWGLNDHIRDVTRRFAAAGYTALAPDLYHGAVATEPDEARKLVMELDMAEAVAEIGQAIDFLLAQEYTAGDKVGVVGFCMGGRLVLMTALENDNLGATVAFYGSPLTPEQAPGVKAPLQGHYGAEDGGIPVDAVKAMGAALDEAGIPNEIYVYEGAPHAFFNDTRSSYRPEAAAAAWERTLAWFQQYLGG